MSFSGLAQNVDTSIFDRSNLVAWCIVPFDSVKRGPEARAEMLVRMGVTKLAYDWRAEHIPTFDDELETLERYGITLQAFWFPAALNDDARTILEALERHDIQTELWITMNGGSIDCSPEEHRTRIDQHADTIEPVAKAAAAQGCRVGLYNHGGWFGEPRNQIDIIEELNARGYDNVGLVYNQHHGHAHVDEFAALLDEMLPYLYCLNLNGMEPRGDEVGKKIWPLGSGSLDKDLLAIIARSGYRGTIGILNHHVDKDAEAVLLDNIDGLEWIAPQIRGQAPKGPRPALRSDAVGDGEPVASVSEEFGQALGSGVVYEGREEYRNPPLTVACWARLDSARSFNIVAANDTKASGKHWEIFTEHSTGKLAVYTPGNDPDHLHTDRVVTDGTWHHIVFQYDETSMALLVDGDEVGRAAYASRGLQSMPGGLGIGRLVSGQLQCDGAIDDVHIMRGIHDISPESEPASQNELSLVLWDFDDLKGRRSWRDDLIEDPLRRAALPLYQVIPAATSEELTPAIAVPDTYFTTWTRSHGDSHNTRYASVTDITRETVAELVPAWTYRSGDGPGYLQCNPILVGSLIITPTVGQHVVGIDVQTGQERWRFNPEGRPALRGLTHWQGTDADGARVLFPAGTSIYALDPATGKPIATFGDDGRITPGESVVAPVVYRNTLVVPSMAGPVWGFDVRTGAHQWTFDTKPKGEAFGGDSWDGIVAGANCWGGMALDEARGIAYISTGSPKPNFAGNTHRGQNIFANSVVALEAETGNYLWHFQEIRHDIWDLDIPAPPNLVSIERDGQRVDVVAQVTKLGNTLVLDRVTGKPLFPFRLRRAPTSKLPGERTWPYQPDPVLPAPFARQVFTQDDITTRTPQAHAFVKNRLVSANMGWFEPVEENVSLAFYGMHGGAEWTGAAVDPKLGKLYVSANNVPWLITVFQRDPEVHTPGAPKTRGRLVYEEHCMSCHGLDRIGVGMAPPLHGLSRRMTDDELRVLLKSGRNAMPAITDTTTDDDISALMDYVFLRDGDRKPTRRSGSPRYVHNGYPKLVDDEGYPGSKPPWGTLNRIDLATGKLDWQVPLGVYPDLAFMGETDTGAENFGGPTVTATGVVFCAGTPDNRIRAFDANTGAILWEHDLPYGGYAPPSIFNVDGKSYVVIAATGGGKLGTPMGDAIAAFTLPPR